MKVLNKPFYVVLLALFTVLSSCSSDDDRREDPSGGVLGLWNITELKFSGKTEEGVPVTGEVINLSQINATVTFKENGHFTGTSGSGYMLKLTFDGNSYTIPISPVFEEGTWVKVENSLTITDSSGSTTFEIATLTSTKMILKANEVPGPEEEGEGFSEVDYTMVLTR